MTNLNGFKYNSEFNQFEKIVDCKVIRVNEELTTQKADGSALTGQPFYQATVEYEGQKVGAVVYEKNVSGITVGNTYPVSVSIREGQAPWLSVLTGAPRATGEMFGFDENAFAEVTVGQEEHV